MKTELGMNTLMELIYALRLHMKIKEACVNAGDADDETLEEFSQDLMFMMQAEAELSSYYEEVRPQYSKEDLPDYANLIKRLTFPSIHIQEGQICIAQSLRKPAA
ncbi:hypothetical protein V8J88_11410 [Massilia sp. W12]|uniref:hypothetical protein n=1 Tax=Massilia sp. W12 TaxID=3126507 RepID=UPI0030D36F03